MKHYIQYIPSPRRDWKRAVVTVCLLLLSTAISVTAIVIGYIILR